MKKRLLSILLMCCMVLTLLPTTVFAEGGTEESSACTCETACTAESMNTDCPVCGVEGADPENCKCATVESEQKAAPVSTSSFPSDELVDPVIRIRLSPLGGGYYAIENGENCTRTAADFFQPGKAPKGAKITAVTPPTSPSIPVSVNVDSDGTLRCTKTEITTEIAFKSEPYTVTITSDDYAPITAPLTVRQYLNAGFEGPVQFKNRVYGDTYTYTCRVNNPGENGVWSALIQNPDIFEIYQETTDITSEPGKSIYTVQIRAIKASARVTWIDFLYLSDTTMASSKDSSTVITGGAVSTRPLTVTAGSATITEGDALPTDLVSCTGLLDSEGRTDDRDTVLDNALSYRLLNANNEEVAADTARNTPGTYTVVPAATLKSGWDERYSLNRGNGTLTVEDKVEEQFTLTPGGRYYFDLSAMNIPGTANSNLPDSTLHYVPFTYAGTIEAYKLTSAMATTEEYAQQNKYPHSLFVADYAVTHTVSWNGLNDEGLIFGKNYASGGVDYTLRAPSVGSNATGSGDSQRGVPQSNEWDTMLNKNSGYIKNWNGIYSWGQDTTRYNSSFRAVRGFISARLWGIDNAASSDPNVVFRPVLEILNPDTLGSDGLKVVTLDLGGGTLGNSSEDIQIIVKTGSEFTAPASDGMTHPNGDTGSYFMWLGSDGKLYAPGASVPADVTKLTAQFALSEQFSLTPGGRYYFDLSAMNIPGTANSNLPDSTLHYVPFTYVGTVNAYKLTTERATTEEYAQREKYPHSLFIADYNVTFNVDWNQLNEKQMIFGTPYTSYGVNYTMRAPSAGSQSNNGKDDSSTRGIPKSNEWDAILDKANQDWKDNISGYIKNWSGKYSFGQDNYAASYRAYRGYFSARFWGWSLASTRHPDLGFRPVLEVLNPDTLDSDGLKVVTLDLGGGKLGGSSDAIHIIVKTGSKFTAPASDGMTRPDGNTGSYFMWLGSDGKLYAPGASVPADVTALTVQWTAPTYTITLNTNGGTINSGNVTGYTYGVGATLPTAGDMTYTGHTFKGWYDNENLTGSPVTAIGGTEMGNKEYWAKWEINQYTITYDLDGGTAAEGNPDSYTVETDAFTLKNPTRPGFTFTGWSGTGLTGEDNLTVTIQKGSTGNRSYTAHWRYNGGGSSGYSYYTIKATAGTGGSISPSGSISVREGRDQTFTITPDKGYAVANVKIDGKSIGAVKSYTFENVRRTHTIDVIFMKANGNPQTGVFVDVATGSYYEDAVDWAVENGITKGTDDTHFSPDGICTRAQAVTFLWRAAGSPEPKTNTMPFTDVNAGSYYYDAVLWAVENGITKGTSDTTFSPNMTCSRAQIVAFLWRSEKSPAAGTANPFADVKSTAYYAGAVLWAVKENITKGTTNTTFSPDADCTRAQIVTFLWRCKK